MLKQKEKNTFLNYGRDFYKTKPDRNTIVLEISKVFDVGFEKPTWDVI